MNICNIIYPVYENTSIMVLPSVLELELHYLLNRNYDKVPES